MHSKSTRQSVVKTLYPLFALEFLDFSHVTKQFQGTVYAMCLICGIIAYSLNKRIM